MSRGGARDPEMHGATTRDSELDGLEGRETFGDVGERERAAGLVVQFWQVAVVPGDRLAVDDAGRRDIHSKVAVGRAASEARHVLVETRQAARRRGGVVGKVWRGTRVLLLPDGPDAVDVAVMEEENWIIGRSARLHGSVHP